MAQAALLDKMLHQQGDLMDMVLPLQSIPASQLRALNGLESLERIVKEVQITQPLDTTSEAGALSTISSSTLVANSGDPARQIGFRFSRYNRVACDVHCGCRCHRQRRRQSPRYLSWLLGQLFMSYAGLPQKGCDAESCRQKGRFSAHVTYYFPTWFLARMLLLTMTTTSQGNPVAGLYMRNTLPEETPLLNYIEAGDIDGVKELLDKRMATPNDLYQSLNWDGLSV